MVYKRRLVNMKVVFIKMELSLLLCLLIGSISFSTCVDFQIRNSHAGPIWVGIQGGYQKPPLENGGFVLAIGAERTVRSDDHWEGRFWARTWCDDNSHHCLTGDCGDKIECNGAGGVPPATLVEIKLRGYGDKDFYDISLVDGYNSQATIRPIDGQGNCPTLSCKRNLNDNCPDQLRIKHDGQTIACNSACNYKHEDQYCCAGQYANEQACKPDSWPSEINSAKYFKGNCPDAYSYAFDDRSSLNTCQAGRYFIEFG